MGEDSEQPPLKRLKLKRDSEAISKEDIEDKEDDKYVAEKEEGVSKKEEKGLANNELHNEEDKIEGGNNHHEDMYGNYVTAEELEKLFEFKVLDEVKSNDEDSNDEDSDSSDGKSDELPEDEIEKMLEEDLPDNFKGAPKPKERPYVTRQKTILEEKGVNHFEVLPLDWMVVMHYSGMPIYMHRTTRVCSLSKPYCLGKGNIRRHEIPVSAVPCLAYRKALEEEEKQKEIDRKIEEQIKSGAWAKKLNEKANVDAEQEAKCPFSKVKKAEENNENICMKHDENECDSKSLSDDKSNLTEVLIDVKATDLDKESENLEKVENNEGETNEQENDEEEEEIPLSRQPVLLPGGIVMPPPRVETVNSKTQHLTHEQMNDYCKKLFKFKTVNIMHFKRWADRRKYTKARKALQYPTLPEGTRLITIPAQAANGEAGGRRRDCVMNMNGRSYLSVFHEYVRRSLQKQPVYEFRQLDNAASPYQATVRIGGMRYGVGHGSSKRQAKAAAARASIRILIPEMRDAPDDGEEGAGAAPATHEPDFSFFDYVPIEDPRIAEFCAATCEPSPHAILRTCLLRNFGAGDRHIHSEMRKLEFQNVELTMKVGKHTATVVCKNKKAAKQRASQKILQALHPHVRSWGSLLRLYGSRSVKSCKERKLEEQQITLLQDQARHNEPNRAVLDKLRHEMRRLRQRDAAVVPIGTLLLPHALQNISHSGLGQLQL